MDVVIELHRCHEKKGLLDKKMGLQPVLPGASTAVRCPPTSLGRILGSTKPCVRSTDGVIFLELFEKVSAFKAMRIRGG